MDNHQAEVRQADFFIQIGPRRPKYKRFSSSDSFRIIFQADEIESRSDFKSNCAVIPNYRAQVRWVWNSRGCLNSAFRPCVNS